MSERVGNMMKYGIYKTFRVDDYKLVKTGNELYDACLLMTLGVAKSKFYTWEDKEDIAGNAYARIYRRHKDDWGYPLVKTAVVNETITQYRKIKRHERHLDVVPEIGEDIEMSSRPLYKPDHETRFADEMTKIEFNDFIERCYEQLTEQQEMVVRCRLSGANDTEGARILGITGPAYKCSLHKAKKKIQKIWLREETIATF